MPLTPKQKRQRKHIEDSYKKRGYSRKKGRSVFYAMENSGKITGQKRKRKRKRRV